MPFRVLPGTPVGALFPRNPQGRPPALRQVMSPKRLAEMAATAGANPAQPVAADHGNQEGFYHAVHEKPPPLHPTMRFVRDRVELIQGKEEFWVERIMVEEKRSQEETEQINRVRC